MVVMVLLAEGGGRDRFFVLSWKHLQSIVIQRYRDWLEKHGGKRPKAAKSFHTSVELDQVLPFEGRKWDAIIERVLRAY